MFLMGLSIGLVDDVLIAFTVSYYLFRVRDTNIPSCVSESALHPTD
jgi:hypothetical protein